MAARTFQGALQKGHGTAVPGLLSLDATVSEGSRTRPREACAADHPGEDIVFRRSTTTVTPVSMLAMPMAATAMIGGESTIANLGSTQPTAVMAGKHAR